VEQTLSDVLPGPTDSTSTDGMTDADDEVIVLTEVDVEAVKERARQDRGDAYDSDEERRGHGGAQRVQCAQQ
jgi:hypothetical protein